MNKLSIILASVLVCCGLQAQNRQQNLTDHVYYLASDEMNGRKAGSEDAARARQYIIAEYAKAGLEPYFDYGWEMPFMEGKYNNVVGFIEGSDPELKNEFIVLGAHYDHLGVRDGKVYNGADDNASGTAALIEVARYLCTNRSKVKRSVIIAAFDAEELGLYGSKALAAKLDSTIGSSSIKLMMSIDMVGWLEKGEALTLEGVATIKDGNALLQSQADAVAIPINPVRFEKSIFTATDTEYFAKNQVPTLAVSTGQKSPYHKPEDDPELIDYQGLDKVTEYVGNLALECAGDGSVAPSGRVAPKHRGKVQTLMFGVTAGVGSSNIEFDDAAFNGKSKFAYSAGITSRLNFGKRGILALQAECLYSKSKAMFPDESDVFSKVLDYSRESLIVPVTLQLHSSQTEFGGVYFGLGGYWSKALSEKLDVPYGFNGDNYGMTFGFGFNFGHVVFDVTALNSFPNIFTGSDSPKANLSSAIVSLKYFF